MEKSRFSTAHWEFGTYFSCCWIDRGKDLRPSLFVHSNEEERGGACKKQGAAAANESHPHCCYIVESVPHRARGRLFLLCRRGEWRNDFRSDPIASPMMTPEEFCGAVASEDFPAIVKLLSDKKVDVDAQDRRGMTPLIHATRRGHAPIVKALLKYGAIVDAKDRTGWTPLMRAACFRDNLLIVKVLLKYGANVDAKDRDGKTALVRAIGMNNVAVMELLLKYGAKVDAQDRNGMTPLIHATRRGHASIVKALLKYGAIVDVKDRTGKTALMRASGKDNVPVVAMLVKHGAAVEARDRNGWTALAHACVHGQPAVVEFLLKKGANVDSRDDTGSTPMHHAVTDGDPFICELLLNHGSSLVGSDPRHGKIFDFAVRVNQAAVVEYFLQRYAEEATEREGSHAIHAILRAATYSHTGAFHRPLRLLRVQLPLGMLTVDHFRMLIRSFAPANLIRRRDDDGALPLHVAAGEDVPDEILHVLAHEYPVALHTRDYSGGVPLHAACRTVVPSSLDTIRLLVELDPAAVQAPDNDGALPVHVLCGSNPPDGAIGYLVQERVAALRFLVEHGGIDTLSTPDRKGDLLIHIASRSNAPVEVIKYLLQPSAKAVTAKTSDGALPFMVAGQASSSVSVLHELLTANPFESLEYMHQYYSS